MHDFKNLRPRFEEKHMKIFSGGHIKKGLKWSFSERICRQKLHKISSGKLVKYGQKSFATSKICSRTHSVLRQHSSQLQKYKAARMFRVIAVDQKVCDWDGRQPGLRGLKLVNDTRIENAHKVRKKIFVFYYVAVTVYVQLLSRKNRYGLLWATMINSPKLSINDEARNEAHIASTEVRLY